MHFRGRHGWAVTLSLLLLFLTQPIQLRAQRTLVDSAGFLAQEARGLSSDPSRESLERRLGLFQQVLHLIQQIGGQPRGLGATLNNIGDVYQRLGHTDSALAYYHRAIPIVEKEDNPGGEAVILSNIASIQQDFDHSDSALIYFKRALPLWQGLPDHTLKGTSLNGVAWAYRVLGRPDSSLVYFRQGLRVFRAVGDSNGVAITLDNIGELYLFLDSARTALTFFREALPIRRELADAHGESVTLNSIGLAFQEMERLDSALFYHRQSLAVMQHEVPSVLHLEAPGSDVGVVLNNIGRVFERGNRADSAMVYYTRALAHDRAAMNRDGESAVLTNLGILYYWRLNEPGRAVAYFDSASAITQYRVRSTNGDDNRLSFGEQSVGLYQLWALAWLARAPTIGESDAASGALAAAESGRAQAMRELMRDGSSKSAAVASNGTVRTLPGADLPAEGRALASTVTGSGVSALAYFVTPDTVLGFLILPGREVQVFREPVREDTLVALIVSLRVALRTDTAGWRALAGRLSALLLPVDLRSRLPATGELVIVPSGPLFLLPFAALPLSPDNGGVPDSTSAFGLHYAIRYAPSLQVLADLESQPRRVGPATTPLVVGNPAMPWVPAEDGSKFQLSQLDSAGVEGRWVADTLGTTELVGPAATEAAVRAQLGGATLVHLATHAMVYSSDARARDSYIALASGRGDAPSAGEDGMLTVGEVLDEVPEMRAELVVLSACETGLGDLKQAEGTVGLQRAFLAKGARSMLVSLWNVSADQGITSLMRSFYRHWLSGDSKAEALRRAQAEVARSFPHPRYWAAFQMVGAR